MAEAWPEVRVAQQEAPEEPQDGAPSRRLQRSRTLRMRLMTIHRSPIGQFNFNSLLMIFYIIKVTNSNFVGCEALS
jgi:hypothetical protein